MYAIRSYYDSPALVPFGSEDMEPAGCDDLLFVLFAVGSDFLEDLQLTLFREVLFPVEDLFEHEVGIAAQEDVGVV